MSMEHDFQKAIKAAPDDDAPRLIFADWLEEQGDPRAFDERKFVALRRVLENPDDIEMRKEYGGVLEAHGRRFTAKYGDEALAFMVQCVIPEMEIRRGNAEDSERRLREELHRRKFDLSRRHESRYDVEGRSTHYYQRTEFAAKWRHGFIDTIYARESDWDRIGWPLLDQHPLRDIVFGAFMSDSGEALYRGQPHLPYLTNRLHLRKQVEGSWAAHWLRHNDPEPPDVIQQGQAVYAMPGGEMSVHPDGSPEHYLGRVLRVAHSAGAPAPLWKDRATMVRNLPRFVQECRRPRAMTASTAAYSREWMQQAVSTLCACGNATTSLTMPDGHRVCSSCYAEMEYRRHITDFRDQSGGPVVQEPRHFVRNVPTD